MLNNQMVVHPETTAWTAMIWAPWVMEVGIPVGLQRPSLTWRTCQAGAVLPLDLGSDRLSVDLLF